MRQAKMAVRPYTATGRKPKCRGSAGMRESGHRRVLKNEFFITLLSTRSNVARVANAHYHHSVNYLAHTFLSHETPAAVIGGFLGDFVKGAIGNRFSPDIEQGILF